MVLCISQAKVVREQLKKHDVHYIEGLKAEIFKKHILDALFEKQ